MGTINALLVWAVALAIAGWGAYFGAYYRKKGENLATKEDIGELTRRTKEIEAKINDQMWNKQRQWELKREAIFPAIQALDRTKTAFVDLWAAHLVNLPPPLGDSKYEERKDNADAKWLSEISRFDEMRSSVSLVCGKTMRSALAEASVLIRTNASLIFRKEINDREFEAVGEKMRAAIRKVNQLARAELGIALSSEETAEDPVSRSSQSST